MKVVQIVGYISKRRCIGKHLAFADIQIIEEKHDEARPESSVVHASELSSTPTKVIHVTFQRSADAWKKEKDETFPDKKSKLPYGGKVWIEIVDNNSNASPENFENTGKVPRNLVHQWQLLENPRDQAMLEAQSSSREGISFAAYLRSRGDAFLSFNQKNAHKNPKASKPGIKNGLAHKAEAPLTTYAVDYSHGDSRAKAQRATIFASWLIDTYGKEFLQSNGGVLDVAGGKGKLSIELAVQGQIPCTIVDPLVRKHGAKLEPRDAKRIRKIGAPHPLLLAKFFNTTQFLDDEEGRLENSQICIGLHPDECTEDILDVALKCDKPLAIVPCCVFPDLFPLRTTLNVKTRELIPVRTYEQFLEYLLAKDNRLERATLPFEGRNVVIFRR